MGLFSSLKKAAKFVAAPITTAALAPVKAVTHVAAKSGVGFLEKANSAVAGVYRPLAGTAVTQWKTGAAVGGAILSGGGTASAALAGLRTFAPAITPQPQKTGAPAVSLTLPPPSRQDLPGTATNPLKPAIVNAPLGPSPGAPLAAPPWGDLPLPTLTAAVVPAAPGSPPVTIAERAAAAGVPWWKHPAALALGVFLLAALLLMRKD